MERPRATPESYARKIKFIEAGMMEWAHEKLPKIGKNLINSDAWRKIVDIGLLYNIGSETTGGSVGDLYGITAERVSQLNEKFISLFHANCSEELQKQYSIETIIFNKPRSQAAREKASLKKGGISVKIKNLMIEKRTNDPSMIAEYLRESYTDITPGKINSHRKVLESWGGDSLSLNRKNVSLKKIREKIEGTENDEELKNILYDPKLTDGSLHGFVSSDKSVFMLLGNILEELSLDKRNAERVAKKWDEEKVSIPVRSIFVGCGKQKMKGYDQRYWVVLTKHKDRIIDVIKSMNIKKFKMSKRTKKALTIF